MWILNSWKKDALFIFLSGPLALMILSLLGNAAAGFALLGIIFLDSGHAYTTIFRTVLHENKDYRLVKYYWILGLVFLLLLLWQFLKVPYLFSMVVYFTFFHYMRQNFGILKWYELKNQQLLKGSSCFLYLSNLVPFIGFHFRENLRIHYYTGTDLFVYPDQKLFLLFSGLHLATFGCFLFYAYSRRISLSSLTFILSNYLVYGVLLVQSISAIVAVSVIVFSHGMGYLAIMQEGLTKTQPKRFRNLFFTTLILFVFVMVVGPSEYFIEEKFLNISNDYLLMNQPFQNLIISLYLLPTLAHYIFDAMIWKRNHLEARLIYR